jgi:charged multivesicular body protein 3
MIGDTFEMMDDEDLEEEADEEVNKVLYQITEGNIIALFSLLCFRMHVLIIGRFIGMLGDATTVANLENPVIATEEEEEEEPELDMMQKRLEVRKNLSSDFLWIDCMCRLIITLLLYRL